MLSTICHLSSPVHAALAPTLAAFDSAFELVVILSAFFMARVDLFIHSTSISTLHIAP
jgi:hypothetical protein